MTCAVALWTCCLWGHAWPAGRPWPAAGGGASRRGGGGVGPSGLSPRPGGGYGIRRGPVCAAPPPPRIRVAPTAVVDASAVRPRGALAQRARGRGRGVRTGQWRRRTTVGCLANECLWGRGSAHGAPPVKGNYKTKKRYPEDAPIQIAKEAHERERGGEKGGRGSGKGGGEERRAATLSIQRGAARWVRRRGYRRVGKGRGGEGGSAWEGREGGVACPRARTPGRRGDGRAGGSGHSGGGHRKFSSRNANRTLAP